MRTPNSISYILNHLGEERGDYRNAVSPPIWQTSNFAMPNVASMRSCVRDELAHSFYTRGNNPTVEILRKKLAALEGAEDALVFASGAAAIAAAVMTFVSASEHIICVQKPYSWTRNLLGNLLKRFGVTVSFIDGTRIEHFAAALQANTKLIVLESPNSLTFELQDLAAVAKLAQARSIYTLLDNSFCSPLHQHAIGLGIDLVAHSATKYLAGHSDVMAGVLCGSKALIEQVFRGPFMTIGSLLGPHDAWLVLRGLRTLPVRLKQIGASTQAIYEFLRTHPRITRVYYPLAPDFAQAALARQQMGDFAGLISVEVAANDFAAMEAFVDALQLFLIAASWGGYESLIMPILGFMDARSYRAGQGLPFTLVRLSIGLEEPAELIADLAQALDSLSAR